MTNYEAVVDGCRTSLDVSANTELPVATASACLCELGRAGMLGVINGIFGIDKYNKPAIELIIENGEFKRFENNGRDVRHSDD